MVFKIVRTKQVLVFRNHIQRKQAMTTFKEIKRNNQDNRTIEWCFGAKTMQVVLNPLKISGYDQTHLS